MLITLVHARIIVAIIITKIHVNLIWCIGKCLTKKKSQEIVMCICVIVYVCQLRKYILSKVPFLNLSSFTLNFPPFVIQTNLQMNLALQDRHRLFLTAPRLSVKEVGLA